MESKLILQTLRNEIDELDLKIIQLIAKRLEKVEIISIIKQNNNLEIVQNSRWNEIIEKNIKLGNEIGLESSFILRHLENIHQESIRLQTVTTENVR